MNPRKQKLLKNARLTLLQSESVRMRAERLACAKRQEFISRISPPNASTRSVQAWGSVLSEGASWSSGRGEGSRGGSWREQRSLSKSRFGGGGGGGGGGGRVMRSKSSGRTLDSRYSRRDGGPSRER